MRRLTDLSDLLTGHEVDVDIEEFSYHPGLSYLLNGSDIEVRFNREYMRTTHNVTAHKGINYVDMSFELHKSESEAISLFQHYEQLEPSNLFTLIYSDLTDRFVPNVFADSEKLEVPGEGIIGLRSSEDVYHLYFLAHGRITGYILVSGVALTRSYLRVENSMPLATEIYARITEVERDR